MARKASARKSAKSSKRKAVKKLTRKPARSAKARTGRKPAKRAPAKGRVTSKRAQKKAPAVAAASRMGKVSPGLGKASALRPAAAQGPGAKPRAGAKGQKAATRPGGIPGALELEAGPPMAHPEVELPTPRRRGPKPGGPDWPGENLTVGMPAPEFELPSTLGRKVRLSEFRGKRVILYFYPKDDTPGCTMEACAFRDNLPRFDAKDGVVLGISLDDELSHQRFAQKYNLQFPLLSDVDAAVSRQYGVDKEKNMYGRSFWGIERTTFVVDREGKVENVFRRVKVEGHADEVLATLAV